MANDQVRHLIDHTNNPEGIDDGPVYASNQPLAVAAYTPDVTTNDSEPADPSFTLPHINETLSEQPEMLKRNNQPTGDRATSSGNMLKMPTTATEISEKDNLGAATDLEIGVGTKRKFSSGEDDKLIPIDDIIAEPPNDTQSRVDAQPVAHDLRPRKRQKIHYKQLETPEDQATIHRLNDSAVEINILIPVITIGAMNYSTSFLDTVFEVKFVRPNGKIDYILNHVGTGKCLMRLADGSNVCDNRLDLPEEMVARFESSYGRLD